jgi:hypothetical protein
MSSTKTFQLALTDSIAALNMPTNGERRETVKLCSNAETVSEKKLSRRPSCP